MQLPSPLGPSPALPQPTSIQNTGNPANTFGPVLNVYDYPYLADRTGKKANFAAAMNAAFQDCVAAGGGKIIVPFGVYNQEANISLSLSAVTIPANTPPKMVLIECNHATIFPSANVTVAFTIAGQSNSDGITQRVNLKQLRIDGVFTAGSGGMLVGENAGNLSGYISVSECEIYRFQGANAYGLNVRNTVGGKFDDIVSTLNTDNLIISGDVIQQLPTVLQFNFCQFRQGTRYGIDLICAYGVQFSSCVVEANTSYGLHSVQTAGNQIILLAQFLGCWFEGNNAGGDYQINIDGTASGGIWYIFRDCKMDGNLKSMHLKTVGMFVIDDCKISNIADGCRIETGCAGSFVNWPENFQDFFTCVTILGTSVGFTTYSGPGIGSRMAILNVNGALNTNGTQAATATAGGGQATPATVLGYANFTINGVTSVKVPYYAV